MPPLSQWPQQTGDRRRYPDCGGTGGGLYDYTAWLDTDLRQLVIIAYGPKIESLDDLWAFVHVFDAAIDEQDRRDGRDPKPVRRER